MDAKEVHLTLLLGQENEESDTDSLEESAQSLLRILEDMDIESVTLLHTQDYLPFAKGESLISGGLFISVLPAMLPKLMEFLVDWTLRNKGYLLQAKLQRGTQSAEIVYSSHTSLPDDQQHEKMIKQFIEE